MRDNTDRTFIFVAIIVIILLFLHQLPSFTVFGKELRKVSILADISETSFDKEDKQNIYATKGYQNGAAEGCDTTEYRDVWPKGVQPIDDFSEGKAGGMSHFYAMLDTLSRHKSIGRPIRIAYYGDSFIESDILVGDFREFMQNHYGGYGVGWIDAGNSLSQYKHTIKNDFSGLEEHSVMVRDTYTFANGGIAERYYKMSSGAKINFEAAQGYPHSARWDVARLYCRIPNGLTVSVKSGENWTASNTYGQTSGIGVIETKRPMVDIHYALSGYGNTLFGIALESDNGVIVDNFSMRGSAGMTLAKIPEATLTDFNNKRPYDLIILQYGMNAVTANSTAEDVSMYMKNMKRVVAHYRKCFPMTSILIVSTPDRGARVNGVIGTMKGVELLVENQRKLASDCGVAFYNLFEAMGGEGSMARLVEQKMGAKDFIHITNSGGKLIAKHIFDSFVAGQRNWTNRHKKQNTTAE